MTMRGVRTNYYMSAMAEEVKEHPENHDWSVKGDRTGIGLIKEKDALLVIRDIAYKATQKVPGMAHHAEDLESHLWLIYFDRKLDGKDNAAYILYKEAGKYLSEQSDATKPVGYYQPSDMKRALERKDSVVIESVKELPDKDQEFIRRTVEDAEDPKVVVSEVWPVDNEKNLDKRASNRTDDVYVRLSKVSNWNYKPGRLNARPTGFVVQDLEERLMVAEDLRTGPVIEYDFPVVVTKKEVQPDKAYATNKEALQRMVEDSWADTLATPVKAA